MFQLAITFFRGTLRNYGTLPAAINSSPCVQQRVCEVSSRCKQFVKKTTRSIFKTSLPLKMVLKSFRFFLFWQLFIFTGGSNEVARLSQQHVEYWKLSSSEWRRSHSSAGQWERRTLSKLKGPNWNLDSVPVITWPRASSSCKPKAARLRNNTPRVVALSRNEAWRSGGSATTRGLLFISRVSVF